MKYGFNGHMVVATAETQADNTALLGLMEKPVQRRAHKPHKKHAFAKTCSDCGETFKGLKGLGIHRSRTHGVRSVFYKYRKDDQKKKDADAFVLEHRMSTPAV